MADETEKRLELPEHEAFKTYAGDVDLASMDVTEANKFIKGFDEWLKKEQEAQKAREDEEAGKTGEKEDESKEDKEEEGKASSDNVLEVNDQGDNAGDANAQTEWEKRYYNQHKAVADAMHSQIGEPKYTNPGVGFEINGSALNYTSPTNLSLNADTKVEALRAVVYNAKKEGIGAIDFSKMKDEKNIKRFFMLAVAHGMKVESLDKIPDISEAELANLSDKERALFKENMKQIQEKTSEGNQEESKEESKDYGYWKKVVEKDIQDKGSKAEIDFEQAEKPEDKARLFLAAKVLGAQTTNVDAKELNVMAHVGELPKIDQMRLMVINKQETGVYKEKDSEFDKNRTERGEIKAEHKTKIGETALGTDERKTAVADRAAALADLKNKSR